MGMFSFSLVATGMRSGSAVFLSRSSISSRFHIGFSSATLAVSWGDGLGITEHVDDHSRRP